MSDLVYCRSKAQYNLAGEQFSARWVEGVYRMVKAGHCHTFNPENVSLSGLKGQLYLHLGTHAVH